MLASVHQAAREGDRRAMLSDDFRWRRRRGDVRPSALGNDTAIATIMWVNNEIGTVQPIHELAQTAKARGALFHTDAVQAFGKIPIDAKATPFDVTSACPATRSAHQRESARCSFVAA